MTSHVFLAALVTALATGLGALPFLFPGLKNPGKLLGYGNALAAGLMLGASMMLIFEGFKQSPLLVAIGVVVGLIFILISHRIIEGKKDLSIANLTGAPLRKVMLIVGIMTLHSFAEGIGIGVAYGGVAGFGDFISISLAVHNIPEGLAIALVLIPAGFSVWQAAGLAIFSSLPQPIIAIPAFLFVNIFAPFLPFGLGLAAGAMLWMTLGELIHEANEHIEHTQTGIIATLAVLAMILFQLFIQ